MRMASGGVQSNNLQAFLLDTRNLILPGFSQRKYLIKCVNNTFINMISFFKNRILGHYNVGPSENQQCC